MNWYASVSGQRQQEKKKQMKGFNISGVNLTSRRWNLFCLGHSEANLALNQTSKHSYVMDTVLETKKQFRNCLEIRNYWKERKRKQRAKKAEKRELEQ